VNVSDFTNLQHTHIQIKIAEGITTLEWIVEKFIKFLHREAIQMMSIRNGQKKLLTIGHCPLVLVFSVKIPRTFCIKLSELGLASTIALRLFYL